jgi:hypothetical protein
MLWKSTFGSMEEMTDSLIQLEKILAEALLAGDDPMLEALRAQYATATVSKLNFTGVGFFAEFSVAEHIQRVSPLDFTIGDVFFEFSNSENPAMAMLAIRNGVIDYLEAVTIYGDWPENMELRSISYGTRNPQSPRVWGSSTERDLGLVREFWSG